MPFTKLFRRGMSCADVLEVLQSYLDGETDPEIARQVAAHLGRCNICEHESQVYDQIKVSLSRQRANLDPEILMALNDFGQRIAHGEHD